VENLVGYAKRDLMIPQAPLGDLAAANAAAAAWCAEVNGAVHSEICAVPAERLFIERELLRPLPSLRAATGRSVTRKVDRLSCVRFASARYSVPVALIGAEVRLRTDDGRLLVIMTGTGQVVAEHFLVPPGEASVRDQHYGGPPGFAPPGGPAQDRCGEGVLRAEPGRRGVHHRGRRSGLHPAGRRAARAEHAARRPRRAAVPRRARPHGRVQPLAGRGRAVHPGRGRRPARQDRPGRRAGPRAARCPGPAAAALRDRRPVMTAAPPALAPDLAARLRRLKLAAMRHLAPELLIREDPAVAAGGAAAHPDRRRARRPGRLQRLDPDEERRVPRHQGPRRARPVPQLHP